ncbi:arginine deiminase [Cutibacterium acnes JCM 18916]|nr:arginine deiminase [Cutibacterium acnes JCM 18916]
MKMKFLIPPLPNTQFTRDTTAWIFGGVTFNNALAGSSAGNRPG